MTVCQSSWDDTKDDPVPIRAVIIDIGPLPFQKLIDQRLGGLDDGSRTAHKAHRSGTGP